MDVGVCIRVIGNLSLIPEDLCKLVAEAMTITRENNKAFLNLAFAYTCKYNYNESCLHLILYITLHVDYIQRVCYQRYCIILLFYVS